MVLEKPIKSNKQKVKEYTEINYHEKFTAVFGEGYLHPPACTMTINYSVLFFFFLMFLISFQHLTNSVTLQFQTQKNFKYNYKVIGFFHIYWGGGCYSGLILTGCQAPPKASLSLLSAAG